jgi:hypothetical protein
MFHVNEDMREKGGILGKIRGNSRPELYYADSLKDLRENKKDMVPTNRGFFYTGKYWNGYSLVHVCDSDGSVFNWEDESRRRAVISDSDTELSIMALEREEEWNLFALSYEKFDLLKDGVRVYFPTMAYNCESDFFVLMDFEKVRSLRLEDGNKIKGGELSFSKT